MVDEESNIADLAKESKQKDALSRIPPIPLVVLAPLLVIIALIAVTVPGSIVLNKASSETADLLSSEYLDSLLSNVKVQTEETTRKLAPLTEGLLRNLDIASTFTGPLTNLVTSPAAPVLLSMGEAFGLASLACYTAHWKPGYDSKYDLVNEKFKWMPAVNHAVVKRSMFVCGEFVLLPRNANNVFMSTQMQYFNLGVEALGVTEDGISLGNYYGMPYINQTGYLYQPFNYHIWDPNRMTVVAGGSPSTTVLSFTYAIADAMPPLTLEMLGKASAASDYDATTFGIAYFGNGWTVGYVGRMHFPQNNASLLPDYACAAGLRVDDQWNTLLRELKPSIADSVVAIYNPDAFVIIASSNMHVDDSKAAGANMINQAIPDEFTKSVQAELKTRFTTGAQALAQIGTGMRFNANLQDRSWVLNSAVIQMTKRDSDRFIMVVAIPHSEIYGTIESSRKRSLGLSVGIAVAMAVLVGALFVAITLPLARLASQMAQLTTLNFGTLESSGALERRSIIWELRRVQMTFATMVKAFAGQLKKNRSLMQGAMQTSSLGGTSTSAAGKKTVVPGGIRETAPLMAGERGGL
ncbi:hypothetical protein HDU86_003453 [Geranomyces michiganensis]|nr:hypothetical protein HDU86_003453 [Geranomyces michiganensis]